jgi:hypothetical protein
MAHKMAHRQSTGRSRATATRREWLDAGKAKQRLRVAILVYAHLEAFAARWRREQGADAGHELPHGFVPLDRRRLERFLRHFALSPTAPTVSRCLDSLAALELAEFGPSSEAADSRAPRTAVRVTVSGLRVVEDNWQLFVPRPFPGATLEATNGIHLAYELLGDSMGDHWRLLLASCVFDDFAPRPARSEPDGTIATGMHSNVQFALSETGEDG